VSNIPPPAGASAARGAEADLAEAARRVRAAQRIVVLTGAGVSAESGVPTFRDAQAGLWARYRPEELATEQAFRDHPQMVWDWYAMRRGMVAAVEPNAGHLALAAFGRRHPGRLTLVTQNVDGLHQRAGSQGVLALHGSLAEDRWLRPPRLCCEAQPPQEGRPPRCATCGNLRRPAVVWFGEALPAGTLQAAEEACAACDLMLVVGTSALVHPAAGLADLAPGRVVIVNPAPTPLDAQAALVLRGTAATLLPRLFEE
jgi:NAD-dependent deacetylase